MIYCDAGYTDYDAEDNLQQCEGVSLQVMRKKNSRRATVDQSQTFTD